MLLRHFSVTALFAFGALAAFADEPELKRHDPAVLLEQDDAFADFSALPTWPGKTYTVHHAVEGEWQYNLHSYLIHHDGRFWAMWSAGYKDEGAPGQRIHYATSTNGKSWSNRKVLVSPHRLADGGESQAVARGFVVRNGQLSALVALLDTNIGGPDWTKRQWINLRLNRYAWDGKDWQDEGVYLDDCMNNFPPRPIKGRLFMTSRNGDGRRMHTAIADSLEGKHWTITRLPDKPPVDRTSEPSWYIGPDEVVHMLFRDQNRSHFLHRSVSYDDGVTWSIPVRTNYPDATSKNFSGRLSNGLYYLISNPDLHRHVLAVSFSTDGWIFGDPHVLRKGGPALRYPGRSKNSHTFQYPHAIEQDGSLWVIYGTNKEDIEVTAFSLDDLSVRRKGEHEE